MTFKNYVEYSQRSDHNYPCCKLYLSSDRGTDRSIKTALIQTSSHSLMSNFICLASREHCKICFKHILQRLDEASSQCAAYQLFIDSINLH